MVERSLNKEDSLYNAISASWEIGFNDDDGVRHYNCGWVVSAPSNKVRSSLEGYNHQDFPVNPKSKV